MAINIALQPKQKELKNLIESNNQYEIIGFGGARGGAKSHAIRSLAIYFGMKYHVQSLIFRRYSDDLLKNHIYPMFKLYPELRPYFNKTEKILYHPDTDLPIIKFDYADREDEIEKVGQGTEYPLVFVDEATQSTQKMIEYLTTCNRDSENLFPSIPKTILTMNPGGVGHAFVKRIMVDRKYTANEEPNTYYFLQASVWDNVFWSLSELHAQGFTVDDYYYKWNEEQRKDFTIQHSTYAKRLSRLPEDLKMAFLFGDWNTFGGIFFKGFNSNKQIIDPFMIHPTWKLVGSLDPGYSSPCSFSLGAMDHEDNYYRLCTYYVKEQSPSQHAQAIASFVKGFRYTEGRKPDFIVADPSAWAKKDKYAIIANERTFADEMQDVGLYLEPALNDRITGWWALKDLMQRKNTDGTPKYFVFRGYNEPFELQIQSTVSDPKRPEDILGAGNDATVEDHAIDEERYRAMAIYKPVKAKVDDMPDFWQEKIMRDRKKKQLNNSGLTAMSG